LKAVQAFTIMVFSSNSSFRWINGAGETGSCDLSSFHDSKVVALTIGKAVADGRGAFRNHGDYRVACGAKSEEGEREGKFHFHYLVGVLL
jgi:hypothetical protein